MSFQTRELTTTAERFAQGLNTSFPLHHAKGPRFSCAATAPIHVDNRSGLVGLVIGTPLWTTDNLRDFANLKGQSAALIEAYLAYGEQFIDYLRGAFAIALIDPASSNAILGIDRMGRLPLYYSAGEDGLKFGTSARSVLALQSKAASLNPQGLYNYIYFHMVPAPQSVFEDINKLQSGCVAKYDGVDVSIRRYWHPRFREQAERTRVELYAELKSHLKRAVAASLPTSGKVGAFLSGGLDSSTVTGMLAELSDGSCDAYSIGFAAEGYDEMAYARITADHFGARLHEYYVTPSDVVAALPLIAGAYDEPFGNSSALPAYFCAKLAVQDGTSLLLAGDGGDEIFAGNERYAKQKRFGIYHHIPEVLAQRFLEPLVTAAPSWLPLANKARSYIAQAQTPLPDRLQAYNFLHRHTPSDVFVEDFLATVDTDYPLTLQRAVYGVPDSASELNRMLVLDWQFTLADNDLRKVSQTCALAGIDVVYPMLDDDLVDFSLRVPSNWKLPRTELRDFYKKGLRDWLPDATLNKRKQGFGLPFGVWMRTHPPLQEIAYDNILTLKSRGMFDNAFLDNAITRHRQGHAAYFGELIWILCVLELWLQRHFR